MEALVKTWVDPIAQAYTCAQTSPVQQCVLANSFIASFSVAMSFGLFCFFASRITGNDSWVDRLWSIVPAIYGWMWALLPSIDGTVPPKDGSWTASKQYAAIITLWAIRLTFNYNRRGGYYKGEEDYRWQYVRKFSFFQGAFGKILYLLFSFFFISFYQHFLLWSITVPLSTVSPAAAPISIDHAMCVMFLVLLTWETTADQQQWNFQNEKRKVFPQYEEAKKDYARGFRTRGLWALSRKPNVWAESQMWVVIYGASLYHADGMNATCLGFILLGTLLIGAANYTESITAAKYPAYRVYRKHVPMLVPRFFGGRAAMEKDFEEFEQAQKKKSK